jgi:hypothetical protein
LATTLLLSVVYFWYAYYSNPAPIITWDHFQQLNTEEVLIKTYSKGIFDMPVYGDNYLVYEILGGSELMPNTVASYIFLIVFSISLLILLSVVSSLGRFWFIIGMGIFCVFMMLWQVDATQLFGLTNRIPSIATVLLFCLLAYYFHAFRSASSFVVRFLSFGALYSFLLIIIGVYGHVQDPLLHLSVNSFSLAVVVTVVFILMVAHEIPAAFINVITKGASQSKSMQHFLVIIAFYLLNLLLAYGIKIGYMSLNIWVVDFFLLFTVSALLGIWGFRQREPLYESFFPADPIGIYFILGMGAMSFGTIGYFMATANDTILIVFKDVIIYSHLGYGIIFLFYVIANFGSMLTKNLQVHKVLYKPNTMPYFTFRFMGLICTFAFLVFDTNWRTPFNQIFASYNNSYADIYLAQGDIETAERYYLKSVFFRNQNHHAHYALAGIKAAKLEAENEIIEWKEASYSNPPPQTIVNLSNAYKRNHKTAEAVYAIERASQKLVDKGAILNMKGLIYNQLNMSDSALLAFQQARKFSNIKKVAETNLLATSARFKITYPADSLLMLIGSNQEGPKANALALANLQKTPIQLEFSIGSDTALSATKAAFICNYFINQREVVDTTLINEAVQLARLPINDSFKDHLLMASAQAYYAQGLIKRAFDITRGIAYRKGSGKHFLLLGHWALEQGNPEIAGNYFALAKEKQEPSALFSEAIALTEAYNFTNATLLWDSLSRSKDSTHVFAANKIISLLNTTPAQSSSLNDEGKYLYCRYKISLQDSSQFLKVVNSMRDEELKSRALIEHTKKWYALDEPEIAARFFNMLQGLTPTKESTLAEFYYMNGMLLADAKNWDELQKQMSMVSVLKKYYRNELIYWQALLDEKDGKSAEAYKKFDYLGKANMYFEEALINSSQFFARDTAVDRLKSYSMLVEGLLVKPNSVKLLKAYVKEAAIIGFDDEAAQSLEKLKALIPRSSFNRYVKENPDFFDVE